LPDFGHGAQTRSLNLFLDQSGRAPSHQRDPPVNANTSLVALANGSATAPMVCNAREQEAAQDGAVDASEPTMIAAGKADTPSSSPRPKLISL